MSVFDIIITAILLFALVRGYITGIIRQLGVLLGIILGIIFSSMLAPLLSEFLTFISGSSWHIGTRGATILSFILIFLLTYIIGHFIHRTAAALKIGWFDSLSGAIFNCAKYLLIISLLLNIYKIGYEYVSSTPAPVPAGVTYDKIIKIAPLVIGYAEESGVRFTD